MSLYLPVKKLVYKELQSAAKAADCKLILLDSKTYKPYTGLLEKKMKVLGIDASQYRQRIDAIEDYKCIAVVKSDRYFGLVEVADMFKKAGLKQHDVHILTSTKAMRQRNGDVDASMPDIPVKFFYQFVVDVRNEDNEAVMESR